MRKDYSFVLAVLLLVSVCGGARFASAADKPLEETVSFYKSRYPLADVYSKLVDDHGQGFGALVGVRNFRAVLPGIVYRGGANNVFRKPQRDNRNPLPPEGLSHLYEEGFGEAVYLYSKNYTTAEPEVNCSAASGGPNKLTYIQRSPLDFRHPKQADSAIQAILATVYSHLTGDDHRPIFLHCWNGWHASGYASAIVLRQFCDVSGDAAVKYWDRNTDNVGVPSANTIHQWIRAFTPLPQFAIPDAMKKQVCPQM